MACMRCGNSTSASTAFAARRRAATGFRAWSRAAAKFAAAKYRDAGGTAVHPQWSARAAACRGCEWAREVDGVTYCGTPMQRRGFALPQADVGCGCPTVDKARDPSETCPRHVATRTGEACSCPWCRAAAATA